MMRKNLHLAVCYLAALPACLIGQTMVEHAIISGGTATAGASGRRASRAMRAALKNAGGRLDTAAKSRSVIVPVAPSAAKPEATAAVPKTAHIYEDPAGIKPGMSAAELTKRFGEPSMTITGENGEQTLYYARKDGVRTPVHVSGGKVVPAQ